MYKRTLKSLLTLIRLCLALLRRYLAQLFIHLSVIRLSSQQKPQLKPTSPINRTYLASFVVFCIACTYGIIGLHYESGQPLTWDSLRRSKYFFWRQMYLPPIWRQIDISIVIVLLSTMGLLLDFSLKQVDRRYLFVISSSDRKVKLARKDLSTYESTKLVVIFRRARLIYKLFGIIIWSISMLYTYLMVFLVTKLYFVSFWSFTFWIAAWPFILLMYFTFTVINLIHIIVSGSCTQTRQQFHCKQFTQLVRRLSQKRPTRRRLKRVWFKYLTINRSVLSIGLQLEAFNAFYTNYLTAIFLKYTVVQVMCAYIFFFASADQAAASMIALKGIFIFILFEMGTLLFGLIQYCALVVKKNGQITRLNRQFAVHCLRHQEIYRLRVGQLLKIELLQWPRLLHLYAFKVFGGSRITSKTFYAMAINISGFFLFITKRM